MKTAKQFFKDRFGMAPRKDIQLDTISVVRLMEGYAEEAIKEAAERAKAYNQVPRSYSDAAVDKESILSLIKELK